MLIDDIRVEVARLAAVIETPAGCLPNYGSSNGDAHPHIEVHGNSMSWVVQERGTEHERRARANCGTSAAFWSGVRTA